jgi:Caspase domain
MHSILGPRGRGFIAATAFVANAIIFGFAMPANAQTRVALVVGNGVYQHAPEIPNPPHDAADVAAAFLRPGFSVRLVTDGTYDTMRRALVEFNRKAREADMAVVFFAGHGMEVGGENWLIPVDAELKTDSDMDEEAISLRAIILIVSNASKLGLVMLDACRNNPFLEKMKRTIATRSVSRGLGRVEPTNNVLVAYAAKDGTTAADGDGRNSPFTAALLKYLEAPGLEINFLFRNVHDDVIAATGREQQPFVYGSLTKEAIYLKPAPAVPASLDPDQVAWAMLKETTDEAALKRFTEQYPKSPLRQDAEARIAALGAAQRAAPVPLGPDGVTWLLLKETTDEAALARFIARYPNSALRKDAEARIAALAAPSPSPDDAAWLLLKDTTDEAALKRFSAQYPNTALRKDIEARIAALEAAKAAKSATVIQIDPRELARSLQLELKRVGCFEGIVNGEFDDATKAAWHEFTKLAAISMPDDLSSEAIKAVRGINKRVCPLVCPGGSHAKNELCVSDVPPPKVTRSEVERAHRSSAPSPRPVHEPAQSQPAAAERASRTCSMLFCGQ